MLILARYGELGLKSNQIKKKFEKKLVENLKEQLTEFNCKIKCEFSRIFIEAKEKNAKVFEKIKNTPGIVSFSEVEKTDLELENMLKKCSKFIKKEHSKTFGLRITRAGIHEFTSQEIAIKLGDLIREKYNLKVNLTNPDLWIYIEIRNRESFIFTEKIKCIGGLPVGIEGNIFSFIETELDAYSSILMMKRGCKIFPITSKKISNRQIEFLELLKKYDSSLKVLELKKENLEEAVEFFKIKAIVSGLTLETLEKIKEFENYSVPVLFPNCVLTKDEILEKLKNL